MNSAEEDFSDHLSDVSCLCKTYSSEQHIVKTICNLSVKLPWINREVTCLAAE